MITLERDATFITEALMESPNQREYILHGGGYKFHAVITENTKWVQVLPTDRYSPPERCVEYVYYDADCRLGLDAIDEFFTEQGEDDSIANRLRESIIWLN